MRHLLVLIALAVPSQAPAQVADVICDGRERMVARLEGTYGASVRGTGLRGPDVFLEMWSSAATGEWALVQTYTDGRSCIVAMGEDWETTPEPPSDS
ncbi:MAG: hypothetical protein EP307_03245 [Rhodobacteraceae bacterium]|nr:MAG: hypothetical protein EP307_03245 [Paracoccaceae bacterium]